MHELLRIRILIKIRPITEEAVLQITACREELLHLLIMVHNMPYQAERVQKAVRVILLVHTTAHLRGLHIAADLRAPVEVPIHPVHPQDLHPVLQILPQVLHQVQAHGDLRLAKH